MALYINTNILALTAWRNLSQTENKLSKTIERLATGNRIVSAADDPAGLAISDSMNATIRSLTQATRNAQDAISLIQVFEGGTHEIANMLVRLRELAMQAASDTIGAKERNMLNHETQELKNEITRVARTTTFMDRELLAGEEIKLQFQIGAGNNPDIDRIIFDPGKTDLRAEALGIGELSNKTLEQAQNALPLIDDALTLVNEMRARIGSSQNRLQTTVNSQGIYSENMATAMSRVKDADMALETTELTKYTILRQAGTAVLQQANQTPALALQLLKN